MGYTVVRRLGRGGMGVVDLAEDSEGNLVAVKRVSLHGSAAEMDEARRRIRREAEVLARLDHPGLVPLLAVDDDDDDVVLVMPHLAGGSLAERVAASGPLPAGGVEVMAEPLLGGLAAAHRQGVVHRDIKPANVLLDDEGRAHLADFGVASSRDLTMGLTGSDRVVGTPAFMAPEQARGEAAGPASDVFSLGATLLYALTGTGPYGAGEPAVLMWRASQGQVEPVPDRVPPELRHRLEAMLHPDAARRPTAAALAGGVDGTRYQTPAAGRPVPGRGHRTVRRAVAAASVVLLAGGAALGFLAWRSAESFPGPLGAEIDPGGDVASPTTDPCVDLPYQPCGEPPAPNTDGRHCLAGFDNYDGDPATGCEAEPLGPPDGSELVDAVEANLVPRDDVDTYRMVVEDRFQLLCDGTLEVTLTAPAGVAQRLEILEGETVLGTTSSADGEPATVALREPSCFEDDSTILTARVSTISGLSAEPYRLERRGSW